MASSACAVEGTSQSHSADFALSQQLILKLREHGGWATAAALRHTLPDAPAKLDVNRVLYGLKEAGAVDFAAGSPPTWRLREGPKREAPHEHPCSGEPLMHVVVDLGNCHDCLQNLVDYAACGSMTVAAYADLAFAGFGVTPPLVTPNVQVFQADTPDKNSADTQMIWDISRLVQRVTVDHPTRKLHIVVVTKDLGFQRLKALVEAENPLHKLTFVTNWPTLRLHVE